MEVYKNDRDMYPRSQAYPCKLASLGTRLRICTVLTVVRNAGSDEADHRSKKVHPEHAL